MSPEAGGPGRGVVCSLRAALLLALLVLAGLARAHELNLAQFELRQDGTSATGQLAVVIQNPGPQAGPSGLSWPSGCQVLSQTSSHRAGRLQLDLGFECSNGLDETDELVTAWGADGAILTRIIGSAEPGTEFIPGRADGVRIPLGRTEPHQRSLPEVLRDYTRMGGSHILEGWDHLAFVLCLCLLTTGRRLVLLVTAFTIGHSLSLALAHLGYLTVPMPPVEAVIALSVAFMAREVAVGRRRRREGVPGRDSQHVWVVAGFGLLHGLGFASELSALGVTGQERVTGLLAFNLGVELGQLAFVGLVLLVLHATRLLAMRPAAEWSAMMLAGFMGMYWFSERMHALVVGWLQYGAGVL